MEMTTYPTASEETGIPVETGALKALQFYADNYAQLMFKTLGSESENIVLREEPFECRFCGGKPPTRTFRNRAHAVSALLGNRVVKSRYECDDCGKRFCAFEDDLGKMTMPFRSIAGVSGNRGVPTLLLQGGNARMEFKDEGLHVSHDLGDNSLQGDELTKTISASYIQQGYRPLGAYKALCKSAFTLLPQNELVHFPELRQWLLHDDVTTYQVYPHGGHICCYSFVPGFRPFPQTIVGLFRRKEKTETPYMSFFVAFGNVSYQLFLPCPAKDAHLRGKNKIILPYPHAYQLQPWRANGPITCVQIDLSASERTESQSGTMSARYDRREKIEQN